MLRSMLADYVRWTAILADLVASEDEYRSSGIRIAMTRLNRIRRVLWVRYGIDRS